MRDSITRFNELVFTGHKGERREVMNLWEGLREGKGKDSF